MNTKKMRWMKPEDIDQVVSFCSVSKLSIKKFIRKPNGICIVSIIENKVVGFIFYEIKKNRAKLHHISIHPDFRRKKVGSEMVSTLISRLGKFRKIIQVEVSEYNLPAQLFFNKIGFKAKEIIRDTEEDFYCFEYSLEDIK